MTSPTEPPHADDAAGIRDAFVWPARRPILAILIAVLAILASLWSASRIESVGSLEPMFDPHDPRAAAMLHIVGDFSAAESLMLLVSLPDEPGNPPATREQSARLVRYADRLASFIESERDGRAMTRSVVYRPAANMRPFFEEVVAPGGVYYLSDKQFAEFTRRLEPDSIAHQIKRNESLMASASPAADGVARRILEDPLRLSELLYTAMQTRGSRNSAMAATFSGDQPMLSPDGRHLLISIMGIHPPSDLEFSKRFVAAMDFAVQQADPGDLLVSRTGGYAFAEHSERVIRSDMIRSTFWAMVMLQILFLIAYRHIASFPLSFVPIATGVVVGFGLFAWYAARLTPVVAASGAILAGLGVDYCIHYLSHYHAARARGLDSLASSRHTLGTLTAMSAACVTSVLGFAAVGISGVPALRDFAVVGTLGLAGIFIATWWLLPACLRLVDRQPRVDVAPIRIDAAPLMRLVSRHRVLSVAACVAILAAAIVVLVTQGLVAVSPDLSSLSPRPSPPMEAQQKIAQHFPAASDPTPIYLEADSPAELWRLAKATDDRLHEVQSQLEAQGSTVTFDSMSLASLLPDPTAAAARRNALRAIDAKRVEADFRAAIEPSIFSMDAYEGYMTFLRRSLDAEVAPPDYASLKAYPGVGETLLPMREFMDKSATPVRYAAVTLLQVQGMGEGRAARRAVWDRIDAALSDLPGATLTGMELVAAGVERTIKRDVSKLLTVAAVAVIVWLFLVFRRPTHVALTLVPAAFGMLVVLAAMRLLDQQLNVINLIALPMLAGVGVDDGIFLVSIAARRKRDESLSSSKDRDDLLRDFSTSCHAITMTSLTTALGFGSLMLTHTPAVRSLGLVLSIGMIGCWIGSVCLLAPWLMFRTLPHPEVTA